MTEKERAEMRNLRKRVEAQREEIRRLQAGGASPSPPAEKSGPGHGLGAAPTEAITVGALWKATTNDVYLRRYGQPPLKLPSGGRLQLEHRDLIVRKIEIVTRACEAPCFLVETEPRR